MSKNNKKESVFSVIGRWFTRFFLGQKYEEKMYRKQKASEEGPDDSDLIVSPGREAVQRFFKRKFAVISVAVVVVMFIVVFVGPMFMDKYYDAYTEVTLKNLPPNLSMRTVPKELRNDIKMIDSYGSFTVGLSNSGKVYIWGVGKIGATGLNVEDIPEEVQNAKIAYIAAGVDHIVAFGEDGTYYAWGSNRFGQIEATDDVLNNPNLVAVPEEVSSGKLDVSHIKKVTCGYQATAVLMDDGTLYIWGNKQAYSNIDAFVGKTNIVDIDFTLNYVVGIDSKKNGIYTGTRGLYDLAKTSLSGETTKMFAFLNGRTIEKISSSSAGICMLLSDGSIAVTGDFALDSIEIPVLQAGEKVIDVEAGNYHFTCITDKGNVYSFGGDHYYQAEVPEDIKNVSKIYTGAFQSYAVDSNNDYIQSWGLNGFLFGTDDRGASIAERDLAGGAVTMTFGAIAVIIEILLGVSIGCISGYFGGWVDILLMRIAEVFSSIPVMPFMLIISSLLSQVSISANNRLLMIMVVYGIVRWPGFAGLTRAQILAARENEYVTAAQAMGVKSSRIAFKHILPNVMSVILVNMVMSFAGSLQTETTLSFLGFGVVYPQPSWGNMLTKASNAVAAINFPWQWIFTSILIIITTICINTIGDTIRDVMDPKSANEK